MAKKPIFNLRTRKADSSLVVMFYHFKGRRIVITTGVNVPIKFWNDNTQRAKENRLYPEYRAVNARLDFLEEKTTAVWSDYNTKGIIPTAEEFKAELLRHIEDRHEVKKVEPLELLPFIRQIIEERKAMNRPAGSLQVYRNCLGHLEGYQAHTKKPLNFDGLNSAFLSDFTAYLYTHRFSDSYAHKILTTLKMFVRLADVRGIYTNSPLIKAKLEVKKREKDSVYLNEGEIQHLYNLKIEERLERVRDAFLVGCLTGLRFSDFTKIKPENIQPKEHGGETVQCLVITTQKTKQRVVLPLVNPMLLAILEKYDWHAPKAISNQRLNSYLKELAQIAGLTQEVEINEFKAGRHEKRTLQKWELISSHTARRSFASNAFKRGLEPAEIMKFTGHTTVASFLKYVRVTNEETAVILSKHDFFTGKPALKVVS